MLKYLLTLPSNGNLRKNYFDLLTSHRIKFTVIAVFLLAGIKSNAQKTMNFSACGSAATILSTTATNGTTSYTFQSTECEPNAAGFTVESVGTGNLRSLIAVTTGNQYLRTDRVTGATFNYGRLFTANKSNFTISSISIVVVTSNVSQQITLSAYKNGSLKGSVSKAFTADANVFLAFNSAMLGTTFTNIDEIRASTDCSSCNGLGFDDITYVSGALPVELISFTGQEVENKNLLKWNTVQEVNAEAFIIEKSPDGKKFLAIGSVTAANFPGDQTYEFSDPTDQHFKTSYYRLKMMDKDQTFAYSRMIAVTDGANSKEHFVLYPNPLISSELVSLKAEFTSLDGVDISILDESGRESRHLEIGAGEIKDGQATISTNGLPAGTYFFKIHDQNTEITDILRLEKQ